MKLIFNREKNIFQIAKTIFSPHYFRFCTGKFCALKVGTAITEKVKFTK